MPFSFAYDADRARMNVEAKNEPWLLSPVSYGAALRDTSLRHGLKNIDAVVSTEEQTTGSYRGTNAFGVAVRVTTVKQVTKAIFESEAVGGETLFFASGFVTANDIPMDVEEARQFLDRAKAALVVAPADPYFAQSTGELPEATLDHPREGEETLLVVVADIQCGLLLTDANVVLRAYATR